MFSFISILQYQQELSQNTTSCREAVQHYLERIESGKRLNAFTEVYSKEAMERAAQLDQQRKDGLPARKLHGVVIAIKDVLCYKDHTVTAASRILKDFTSVYTSTAVQRLLDEDAIIIGSCNCDEFAMGSTNENSVYGNVLNALDETKVPGGSSGGSAVAVQAGLCMASLGSDTGGSVRQPADFCGITGFKPSYGRISRYGLIAYASSFDQVGIFGTAIEDIDLLLKVMSGPDAFDSTALQNTLPEYSLAMVPDKRYRVAYFPEALEHPSLDKEIRHSIYHTLEQLRAAGNPVSAVSFNLLDYVVPAYYVLTTAEASSNLSRYDGIRFGYRTPAGTYDDLGGFYKKTRSEGFGKEVQRRIMLGTFVLSAGYYDAYFHKALQVRRMLVNKTMDLFREYDVLVLPTSPVTAFPIGDKSGDPIAVYLSDIYTVFANLTGIPGIALPLYRHSNGMPFGLQAMANKEDDVTLLQFSKYIMGNYRLNQ